MPQRSYSSGPRIPIVTLLLSAAAVAVLLVPGAASALQYDRSALAAGQAWRIFTCHWTHFSTDHLLWDVAMFALLAAICERRSHAALLACVVISATLIPAALWVLLPRMQTYRGLSGIDSALFTLLAVDLLHRQARPGGRFALAAGIAVLLVLFVGKIVVEFAWGRALFVDSAAAGMVPVPSAHLVGSFAGLVCSLWTIAWRRHRAICHRVRAACIPHENSALV